MTDVVGSILKRSVSFEWEIPKYNSLHQSSKSPTFSFSGCTWCLQNTGPWAGECLYLNPLTVSEPDKKRIKCYSGYKGANGSTIEMTSRIVHLSPCGKEKLNLLWYIREHVNLKSLKNLTVTCRLEDATPHPVNAIPFPLNKMDFETLASDFEDLFTKKRKCDVIVKVKDKEFEAHKVVLVARSPVFDAMFEHDLSETETGVIKVPDCDADSFEDFLHYLYTGKYERVSPENAHDLYVTSDKYDVQELKSFCVPYMMENLNLDNAFKVLQLADLYGNDQLMSSVQSFFNRNLNEILSTADWVKLMAERPTLANMLLKGMMLHFKIGDKQ